MARAIGSLSQAGFGNLPPGCYYSSATIYNVYSARDLNQDSVFARKALYRLLLSPAFIWHLCVQMPDRRQRQLCPCLRSCLGQEYNRLPGL